jgi:Cd2+/Zn2+-exporting ATPase/Cu+-exporting ATPase
VKKLSLSAHSTLEVPVVGMDCAECARHVRQALESLPGVKSADVLLAAEKAVLQIDLARVDMPAIRQAVADAGYTVPETATTRAEAAGMAGQALGRRLTWVLLAVFGLVLFVVVAGEGLGLFDVLTERIPWPVGLALVVAAGYPIFLNVWRAMLRRQVIAHTLMTLGVIAALVVGEWVTALVVVFFMRFGDRVENLTAGQARRAVKELAALAPQTARLAKRERLENGDWEIREEMVPIAEVRVGDVVVVRPGEKIAVDGEVVEGQAAVDQSAVTGESLPVEAGPGSAVYAATLAHQGSLRVRATHVGADTTFGRVIKLVEEAESHRADVQRLADRFTVYYLPLVATIATVTFIMSRDPLATAAVLVVACACSIALATPIAVLASIGAAAKAGVLIKGGKYVEALAQADVLLIDKTGTLTLGRPAVTDVVALNGLPEMELLALAASAERYSEHPVAEAVRRAALAEGLALQEPLAFEAVPGMGIRAQVNGRAVLVGNRRLLELADTLPQAGQLEGQGKTVLYVADGGKLAGLVAVADTLRPEVPAALAAVRDLGIQHIELITGDNERAAAHLAEQVGIRYRANLLPEDKIRIVKEYQARRHKVVMVGDGINDAPALAQADVGMAMGAAGTDIAIEAAHVALMRDDWMLLPAVLRVARRTMAVVRLNLAATAVYNVVGLTLAAFGILPPILAAAAQSLPDLGILANSSRLIRQRIDQ